MTVRITKIEILNFRSIQKITIDAALLQIIVGNNDVGKSNILRALNLFFNSETNIGMPFDFTTDYNIYSARKKQKKAKEIKIKLTLSIPSSYHTTNGNFIEWTKSWRSSGLHENRIQGFVSQRGPRGGRNFERRDIPPRSNIKQLLNNIRYIYVPAVKDGKYIAKLRSDIYFVVNEVFNENFNDSSRAFEKSIAENLCELTSEISESLGFESVLSLPRDLSNLFGSLDFLNDMRISLNERGDGIKARHIPLILKYIAEKTKTLQARGNPPYTFIWGYEEPENNLELTSSIKLALQFRGFVPDPISQLFITTHSPAFYNLSKKDDCVKCLFVEKDNLDITSCEGECKFLDDKMGVMELLSPYIEEIKSNIDNIESASRLGDNKAVIYVEGSSDKIIIERAIQLFIPNRVSNIEVLTKDFGAGTNYVRDMLAAYFYMRKHHPEKLKCVGIVDDDSDGRKVKQELGNIENLGKSVMCLTLPLSQDIIDARRDGFIIPGILECNYPADIWQDELDSNLLERRVGQTNILSQNRIDELIQSNSTLLDLLEDKPYRIKIEYFIPKDRKVPLANKIAQFSDERARVCLSFLERMLRDIEKYLFPSEI
ncbi:ATP-dependent nuclease [Edwardsiella tarda]|uniref:ATP-dependent nuclease n=1 Tax=Edwardsiella tarda TaxID=636 RepID=UPI003D2ED724